MPPDQHSTLWTLTSAPFEPIQEQSDTAGARFMRCSWSQTAMTSFA